VQSGRFARSSSRTFASFGVPAESYTTSAIWMTDSPSASESGYWPCVFAHAMRMRLREIATPSLTFWPSATGAERAPDLMIQNSSSRSRVVRMSLKSRAPMRR
jgi:hypothetical protein